MIRRILKQIRTALSDLLFLDDLFDWRYGTDTVTRVQKYALDIDSPNRHLGYGYQGSRSRALSKFFRDFDPAPERVLLDLGCGKGKVLLIAALCGFREVHGVDWSRSMCEIARRNIERFQRRVSSSTHFEVVHADVVDYSIQDTEDVFYLYQPFEDVILQRVMRRVEASIRRHPRKVWIVYHDMPESSGVILGSMPMIRSATKFKYLRWTFWIYSNGD